MTSAAQSSPQPRARTQNPAAGATTIKLAKRKLAKGDYRFVVTPVDAAGNRGVAKTVSFKVKKK